MASQLLSANSKYPSSRVYLSTLEAMAVKGAVSRWESIILLFENIPHFTNTCQKYQQSENGDWIAITGPKYKTPEMGMGALGGFGFGGALLEEFEPKDPKGALAYMQDTRAFAESSEVQEEFARLSGVWLSVRKALEAAKKANNPKLFDESLESILKRSKLSELLTVAIAKDAKEAVRKLMPFRAKSARNSGSCQKSL